MGRAADRATAHPTAAASLKRIAPSPVKLLRVIVICSLIKLADVTIGALLVRRGIFTLRGMWIEQAVWYAIFGVAASRGMRLGVPGAAATGACVAGVTVLIGYPICVALGALDPKPWGGLGGLIFLGWTYIPLFGTSISTATGFLATLLPRPDQPA